MRCGTPACSRAQTWPWPSPLRSSPGAAQRNCPVASPSAGERRRRCVRASEKRFRALVRNASDAIMVIDAEGTIRYQSPSVERLLGYPPPELDGTNGFVLVHPDDLPEVRRRLTQILATPGATACVEVRVRHRDGAWRQVEVIGTNLLHEPG